ncbi:MAG: TIGR03000 domain-containing protein [Planctomycetes bacterium]|nr:TIGR03000 domain-containing protein [Planctomycetota bacterium]MBU4399795.1 TIGR03000 domain-containing protein [Planctomycetota bacterium]
MIRASWKCLLFGAVVAIAISSVAPQAEAQWWGYSRPTATWGCSYAPYYTSCYTPCYSASCCDPCGYSGGWYRGWRPGPIRRLLLGRYKWYWGYGGYCCPTYDCCTDVSTCGSAAPAPAQTPTPAQKPVIEPNAMPTEPAPAPGDMPAPAPSPQTNTTSADTSGVLTVWVPYEAKVTINGLKTTNTGSRRKFISHGLKSGFSYKYVVKAELVRDGQLLEDTRTVTLTAGQITAVAFGFNATPAEQVAAR